MGNNGARSRTLTFYLCLFLGIGIGGFPDGDGYALSAWSPAGCAIAIILLVLGAIGGVFSLFVFLL
ncbi:MAG: hypothetical protein CVV21_11360 [Candidatus Goldiibacteriota bacterium HGW-Goldbacteria-1]|nr:MAG: hypothetical protein CVV21_11360 [Candidatus Goldiibacteriota bacterium HGW-Goldbacteria-1]